MICAKFLAPGGESKRWVMELFKYSLLRKKPVAEFDFGIPINFLNVVLNYFRYSINILKENKNYAVIINSNTKTKSIRSWHY